MDVMDGLNDVRWSSMDWTSDEVGQAHLLYALSHAVVVMTGCYHPFSDRRDALTIGVTDDAYGDGLKWFHLVVNKRGQVGASWQRESYHILSSDVVVVDADELFNALIKLFPYRGFRIERLPVSGKYGARRDVIGRGVVSNRREDVCKNIDQFISDMVLLNRVELGYVRLESIADDDRRRRIAAMLL